MLRSQFLNLSKRYSSSSISPEFLDNLLKRVNQVKISGLNSRENRQQKARGKPTRTTNSRRPPPKHSRDPSSNIAAQKSSGPITETGVKRRTRPSKQYGDETYNDLLKVGSRKPKPSATTKRGRREEGASKRVPGLSIKSRADYENRITINAEDLAYSPTEPTALSLVKYTPSLGNTSRSRLVSYGLDVLRTSNFPILRTFNNGIKTSEKSPLINARYQPNSQERGSVKLELEPLTKRFKISADLEKLDASLKGKYKQLNHFNETDFANISKSAAKREELMANSRTVRLSLEKCLMKHDEKVLVYEVCSGLKGVSELTE